VPAGLYDSWASAPAYADSATKQLSAPEAKVVSVNHALEADQAAADSDGDGLSDAEEAGHGTDPHKADTDGDGMNDDVEIAYGSDPLKANTALTIDVNKDLNVNAVDLQLVIRAILRLPVPEETRPDVDRNESVNAVDLQLVIRGILGLT
jgi:hypothetical protein